MADPTSSQLNDETSAWCGRAEHFAERAPDEVFASLALVREGIFLRRRWDRLDPESPLRRRLLGLLAAAQNVCHRKLADRISEGTGPEPQRVEHMIRRLAEDDRYLAELLDDHTLPAESIAFAVECFRDDLHWLGTLVAILDGTRGIDFTGRVLLEQESLQRAMQSREDDESSGAVSDPLHEAARRLRATALARQAEALLEQPPPRDWHEWYHAWQAAGRLMMRPQGATAVELEQAVRQYRARAVEGFTRSLAALPPGQRNAALCQTSDELADTAGEALTFLEDLPLAEAVRSLEIFAEDAAVCMKAVKKYGNSDLGKLRRRLRRRQKAVAAELQERRLGWRMEGLFGRGAVAALERLILLLLVLFVVMLAVEGPLTRYEMVHWPGSRVVETTCAWLDLGICVIFLTEFSLKLALATRKRLYFHRHWITGLLPAIPVGFILFVTHPERGDVAVAGEGFVLLRGLRYLRLPQMARWLRIARPVVRIARLVAFIMQASDRLVRRVAPLVNRNLVLFEQAAIEVRQPRYRTELAALRERFYYRASEVIAGLPHPARRQLVRARIEDLTAMLSGPRIGTVAPAAAKAEASTTREIPLEAMIARLLAATPAGISQRIGRTLAQSVARWCGAFDVLGVRRLPVIRTLVEAGRQSSPYETTAQVANRIGLLLKNLVDRVYWVADLYGTVTAPQLVDSLGDWMIKGTARPARRFLIIGITFLIASQLTSLLPVPEVLTQSLKRLIATPLVVLGLLCLVPLLVGVWFRQIAGEATDFCSQVAEAQFITATKELKRRFARRHHAILHQRVIAPEEDIRRPQQENSRGEPTRAAVEMLFDDYLDAAPFHHSDTKTTTQLLGNLTLVALRETRLGYGRRRRRQLQRLDLAATRSWLRGPYLWFHFISRSIAQQTAKLVVDYNAHALPLDRAAVADDAQIRLYVEWLSSRLGVPLDRLELPAEFRGRWEPPSGGVDHPGGSKPVRRVREFYGSDFTAVHFLSADAELDADVCRRYGPQVAQRMRRDRRDNIRRVFRTYPFHHWPKDQRTFNPLAIHARYLDGGRVLLLPLRLLRTGLVLACRAARQLWGFVRDVLHPTVDDLDPLVEPDPYAVAVRKIHRMRKPVFLECLRMRAEFDPEYLGVSLPGSNAYTRRATAAPIEEDLARIDAGPGVRQEFLRLATVRRRQVLEFRRLLATLDVDRPSAESLRAMAVAYTIDYHGVRSLPEAAGRLKRAMDEAVAKPPRASWSLRALWCRCRCSAALKRLFEQPVYAGCDARRRKAFGRLVCRRRGELLHALRQLTRHDAPADPLEEARQTLAAVARDPTIWSRQLVILRTVQTLSVLDLNTYCDLVAELGEYDTAIPTDSEMDGEVAASPAPY